MHAYIFATPAERPFLAVLQDISALGLLRPFTWCEVGQGVSHGMSCTGGELRRELLTELFNRGDEEASSIILNVPREDSSPEEDALRNQLPYLTRDALSYAGERLPRQLYVTVPWDGTCGTSFDQVGGSQNLVISPEISTRPSATPILWTERPGQRLRQGATALASLANLWLESPQALPWGDLNANEIYVVKTFLHGVDSRAARRELNNQVLQVSVPYRPLPTDSGARVKVLKDSRSAAAGMAKSWWNRHYRQVLGNPLPAPPAPPDRVKVGALEALTMFFQFLLTTLRTAPQRWLRKKYRDVCAGIAGRVQNTVYGNDSHYRVIVGGIDAEGRPASWREVHDAASDYAEGDVAGALSQQGADAFTPVITDYIDASLSLVDGQAPQNLEQAQVDGHPATVDSPDRVVAPMDDWQFSNGTLQLTATDEMQMQAELKRLGGGQTGHHLADQLDRLKQWSGRVRNNFTSFALQILAHHLTQAQDVLRSSKHTLAEYQEEYANAEQAARAGRGVNSPALKKALRVARGATFSLFLAAIILGVLTWMSKLDTGLSIILFVALFIVWLLVQIFSFRVYSEEYAAQLHRAQVVEQNIAHYDEVARVACKHISRLTDLALAIDQWAPIVSRFIHEPFGDRRSAEDFLPIPTDLSASMTVRPSEVDPASRDEVAVALRATWLRQNWAHTLWDIVARSFPSLLTDPANRLQVRGAEASFFYGLPHTDDILRDLSATIATSGVGGAAATNVAGRLLDSSDQLAEMVGSSTRGDFLATCEKTERSTAPAGLFSSDAQVRQRNHLHRASYDTFDLVGDVTIAQASYLSAPLNPADLRPAHNAGMAGQADEAPGDFFDNDFTFDF